MPSPIAHAVSGYAITKLLGMTRDRQLLKPSLLGYSVFMAIAADFDFLPQLIAGIDMHRGFTHSIVFAIAFSLLMSKLIKGMPGCQTLSYRQLWTLALIVYCSHLALDFLTQGGSGVPLLWPLSNSPFKSVLPLFPAVHHSRGLFDLGHLFFISFELIYSTLLLWALSRWKPTNISKTTEYQNSKVCLK